jgi:FkbM family methyltransferase
VSLLSALVENAYNQLDKFHCFRIRRYYDHSEPFDMLIDVGSHKGEFVSRVANQSIDIICFEPQTDIMKELKQKTEHYRVLRYFDCALGSKSAVERFYQNRLTSTSSLAKPNSSSWWMRFKKTLVGGELITREYDVIVRRLDDVLAEGKFEEVARASNILLKVDVEGCELDVLRGAENLLRSGQVRFVQLENARYQIYEGVSGGAEAYLNNLDFRKSASFVFPTLSFSDDVYVKKLNYRSGVENMNFLRGDASHSHSRTKLG